MSHIPAKNIVIRSPNWLGDAIMSNPVIPALRQLYPSARLTVVVKESLQEAWVSIPGVSDIICAPRKHTLNQLHQFGELLKTFDFDLGILLTNSFSTTLEFKYGGIPQVVGYRFGLRRFLINHIVMPPREDIRMIDFYLGLIRSLGEFQSSNIPVFPLLDEWTRSAATILQSEGIDHQDRLIGLNPGAAYGTAKRWFPERYVQLAKALIRTYGAKVVFIGGPGERDTMEELKTSVGNGAINLAGKTSIGELAACMEQMQLFITNDSGPMHLAAALKTPLIAIFGPTDVQSTPPTGEGKIRIVQHPVYCAPCLLRECPLDHDCMGLITLDDVMQAVKDLNCF